MSEKRSSDPFFLQSLSCDNYEGNICHASKTVCFTDAWAAIYFHILFRNQKDGSKMEQITKVIFVD